MFIHHCARVYAEADGEGTAQVPVYQEGEKELVPDRPDRQVQKVEVAAQRRIGDREREFGLVSIPIRVSVTLLAKVKAAACYFIFVRTLRTFRIFLFLSVVNSVINLYLKRARKRKTSSRPFINRAV